MLQDGSDQEHEGATGCWRLVGAVFDGATWRSLALVEGVTSAEVQRLLLNWPPDRAIQVRSCATCGARIARTVKGEHRPHRFDPPMR